jgi:hypothetical protein
MQFVAVGDKRVLYNEEAADNIVTSPDGMTWTSQTSETKNALNSIAWSETQFVAVGAGTILTSPDGIPWTSQVLGIQVDLSGIAWSGTQFVAVGASSGTIFTSQ